ncbi:Endochitinase [Trichinella pseudospiralis]|uniref:Endochitinase n=1 Tax=Trichinella pseudospiralis TaxID=6337 RepID=A0A0V0XW12_TRIPS|nr:Endochitinase [Trichinella pseudospiralis]
MLYLSLIVWLLTPIRLNCLLTVVILCILACHYKPNFDSNPYYADLTASEIPVESCTHLIYESAFVNQFWDVVPRHPSEKLYTSGNRSYAWINRLKTKFKSLATILAIDMSFDVEFYDSLSVRHFRSKLSHSIYRVIEEYAFNGFLLNLPEPVVNKLLSAGMIRSKIVVGLSLKVHSFVLRNPNENIVGASICKVGDADLHEQAYSKYKISNDRWIAFNDEETIREKVAWVQHKNLGGIALTDVNFDDPTGYCSKNFYTFPLVKMAHSQMSCLHVHAVSSSTDDKETKKSQNSTLRLCTYTLRKGNEPFEIDNLINSGCTHLSIYVGKFDSPGKYVDSYLLLNHMELLKMKRANVSAVLLSVHYLDFWKLSSNDTSNNVNLFIENMEHIMNEFGFDGIHLHFEFANAIEEYEKLYTEEEFLHLIHRTGNRKKLLIGGALFKHQRSKHSDFCKQFRMSVPKYEDNSLDPIYDSIETIVRKARFATMYGFGGMALLNVHVDDPSGICVRGSKFPCLRAMKENYLCQPPCETLENHCQKSSSKVICYYSTEVDSDAVFSSDLPLKRCTHLAVNILYFFKDRNGELKIHTSWSTMRILNELLNQGFAVRKLVLALPSFGIQFNLGCGSNVSVEDVLSNLSDHAQYLEYDRKYRMNDLCRKVIRKEMKEFISYRHMGAVAYSCNEILFYERPETIRYKARFAAARGLGGIALYRLNDENDCSSCSGISYCLLDAATADC